jgi:hypothetical protein
MKKKDNLFARSTSRRAFLTTGSVAAGAVTMGTGMLGSGVAVLADDDGSQGRLNKGDIAILRFLQALETVEADLWRQYAELGGPRADTNSLGLSPIDLVDQNGNPVPVGIPQNPLVALYNLGLQILDGDMPQYITDNTNNEFSHASFLKNYLNAKGIEAADLSKFFNLPSSQVTGVPQIGRLTNLTQLTVDTKWWQRYRSDSKNPDFGDLFENAIPTLAQGKHTAIPRTDSDLLADGTQPNGVGIHTQAIAFTAGFHFGFIEQGGSSLYPSLAQRASSVEVLRILVSIGPSETAHFQTWHDKAGNALPITDVDKGFPQSTGATVTFPNLNKGVDPNNPNQNAAPDPTVADQFQTNLIMPEPTVFLNKKFGPVSIIRPTETKLAATGAVQGFVDDGLFIGHGFMTKQSDGFVEKLFELAAEADEARREIS